MLTKICLFNENDFNNWYRVRENSQSKDWYLNLSLKKPLSSKNRLLLKSENKLHKIFLKSNFIEDILDTSPYCSIIDPCQSIENSLSIIRKLEEIQSKVIVNLNFDKLSFDEIKNYYTEVYYLNNSVVYYITNSLKDWDKVISFLKETIKMDFSKVIFNNLPSCIATKNTFFYNINEVFDINEVYNFKNNIFEKPHKKDIIKNFKKLSQNNSCKFFTKCFGIEKSNPSKGNPNLKEITSPVSILSFIEANTGIATAIRSCNPRNGNKDPIVNEVMSILQDCRKNQVLDHKNFFYITKWSESIFFNRALEDCEIWQEDPRGLMSMNWLFLDRNNPKTFWKHKCDSVLPHHGFVVVGKIKFSKEWTSEKQIALSRLTLEAIKEIILKNGGNPNKIDIINNDLYYNNKKFAGKESAFLHNIGYIENTLVTCDAEAERKWLNKIYHHPKEHPITGITNEVPSITKDLLIKELYKKIDDFFREF